jgi:hypothetical protein
LVFTGSLLPLSVDEEAIVLPRAGQRREAGAMSY